ncbi:MAG TPA: glycosyl transferase family 39, partial [Geobacteraceae bacterium]
LANLRKNLREFPGVLNAMMPWYLLLAAGGGLLLYPWSRRQLLARAVIVSSCAPLIIYILFFVQQRGFYPYVTALCVWAGGGLGLLGRRGEAGTAWRWSPGVLLATLLAGVFVYQELPRPKPPYNFMQDGGRLDDKHIGQRLRTVLPRSAVIMTRSSRVAFYAQRPMVLPPQASLPEILDYARQHRATHLVATMMLLNTRPQLEPLFDPALKPGVPFTPPPGLRLVFQGEEPGGLPYLVYEFTSQPNP